VEQAFAAVDGCCIETWATINDHQYFFEYKIAPSCESGKNIAGAIVAILDHTARKLALKGVQDLRDRVGAGDRSARANVQGDGDFRLLENCINETLDMLTEPLDAIADYVAGLSGAVASGDLSRRADERQFQGVYREMMRGLNELIESVANPLDELIEVLKRLAVNDFTKKMVRDYSGVWNELKAAVNLIRFSSSRVQDTVVKISHGDLSELEMARKIARKNENDQLVPGMQEAIAALVADVEMLANAAEEGNLRSRADAAKHQGEFRKVVDGVNSTLDAVLKPIEEFSDCLQEMARGNLSVEMNGDYRGDHSIVKENLNATLDAINNILSQATMAVDRAVTGARQVSGSSQSLSQAAAESASSLEEIAASMHEIASQTAMNAENAAQANQLALKAKLSAEDGKQQMEAMVTAMNDINESASGISKIIKVIDEIAFQTNLLALNAAVEAARAGKHGKGFAVVAEEVRNLAQRSATAAKETAAMIEGSIRRTGTGVVIAEETSSALAEIVANSTKVNDLIGEIASASKEQAEGIRQINTGLSQVDQVTQQVTAGAEESASASEELSSQSLQLKQMLDKFSLRQQGCNQASGLPEGISQEMVQLLINMLGPS
jgi:methyl-accepting chemotaxis protein